MQAVEIIFPYNTMCLIKACKKKLIKDLQLSKKILRKYDAELFIMESQTLPPPITFQESVPMNLIHR